MNKEHYGNINEEKKKALRSIDILIGYFQADNNKRLLEMAKDLRAIVELNMPN